MSCVAKNKTIGKKPKADRDAQRGAGARRAQADRLREVLILNTVLQRHHGNLWPERVELSFALVTAVHVVAVGAVLLKEPAVSLLEFKILLPTAEVSKVLWLQPGHLGCKV